MMMRTVCLAAALLPSCALLARAETPVSRPANLPVYDHIVIVVEENKDYDEIIGNKASPFINRLAQEGARLTRMYGEEHNSEGNYFWLFSGDDQNVRYEDAIPAEPLTAGSLGEQLIKGGKSFKGYSESLPEIGSTVKLVPDNCGYATCVYGRKHVPWISFANIPDTADAATSSNLRWSDFPSDYSTLPTVAFVIPNLLNDMHNGTVKQSVPKGDKWLMDNLGKYYEWAKTHNSLLIVTWDESNDVREFSGLTDPRSEPAKGQLYRDIENRIPTVFAGAHVKQDYAEPKRSTHVNILRTIESMYGLAPLGAQQSNAAQAGIDESPIAGVFQPMK
ncbi:MAG: alkaline phosphatase family protein [Rhizomicrobium sp.]|jgi:acid phosphatase